MCNVLLQATHTHDRSFEAKVAGPRMVSSSLWKIRRVASRCLVVWRFVPRPTTTCSRAWFRAGWSRCITRSAVARSVEDRPNMIYWMRPKELRTYRAILPSSPSGSRTVSWLLAI